MKFTLGVRKFSISVHPNYSCRILHILSSTFRLLIMADKLRTLQQLEALQAKFVSTGHADITRHEWTNNIVRDSYASYIGHPPLLEHMSLGMGESKEIVRAQMIEAMVRGAGKPPAREDD